MRLRFRLTRPLGASAEAELAARAEDWLRGRADLLIAGMGGQVPVVVQLGVLAHADLDRLADLGHRRRLIRPKSLGNGDGPPRRRPTGLAGTPETARRAAARPAATTRTSGARRPRRILQPRGCHQLPAKSASPPRPAGPPGALTGTMTGNCRHLRG